MHECCYSSLVYFAEKFHQFRAAILIMTDLLLDNKAIISMSSNQKFSGGVNIFSDLNSINNIST